MAETLARMVRDGVARREPNPNDKRSTLVSLTRRSRARLSKARAALVQADRETMAGLTDTEQALLRQLLQRVVRNIESTHEGACPKDERQPIVAHAVAHAVGDRVSAEGGVP
jgi:hypothetical protein